MDRGRGTDLNGSSKSAFIVFENLLVMAFWRVFRDGMSELLRFEDMFAWRFEMGKQGSGRQANETNTCCRDATWCNEAGGI